MVSWVDITPTILDWAGVKKPAVLPGRSVLPILEEEKPQGWDVVYGSHEFHEITMYYPMRMIRTRQYKYLLNLAHQLDFPVAQDLYDSKTWRSMLQSNAKMLGERSLESFVHRPHEELYDLEKDPKELHNIAADPKDAEVLADLRKRLKEWQQATNDPWVVKYTHE
jgi:N-sulfoglucosamine sulfohydrolase